jgi:hypothetical protein
MRMYVADLEVEMTDASQIQERRADLLRRSRAEHQQLETLLASLSDEEMTRPGVTDDWSVKDHLIHLTWWEQRVIMMLSGGADPIDAIPNGQDGDDTINTHVYEQNHERPLADVRAAFDRSYQEMLDLIATAPDDVLSVRYDWISGNAADHYDEHLRMLQAWRERGVTGG